jgi:hypothetical protein
LNSRNRVSLISLALLTQSPLRAALGQEILRLDSSDSVLIIGTGPATVRNQATGLAIEYHPFHSMDDTLALRRQALALWRALRPRIDSLAPPFVVLRATTRNPSLTGYQPVRVYGFVIQKRADGKWYLLHDSVSVDQR